MLRGSRRLFCIGITTQKFDAMSIMDMFWCLPNPYTFILLILSFGSICSIQVGSIHNTHFISTINQTFLNLSSWDCTCMALMNLSIAWNYLAVNRSCNLIQNYSSDDIGIKPMDNATFFFRELPPQPLTTDVMTTTTTSTYSSSNITKVHKD